MRFLLNARRNLLAKSLILVVISTTLIGTLAVSAQTPPAQPPPRELAGLSLLGHRTRSVKYRRPSAG